MPVHDLESFQCLISLIGGWLFARFPEVVVWNLRNLAKLRLIRRELVADASRLGEHPGRCHTKVTNALARTRAFLLAISEDAPTFGSLLCINQQDCSDPLPDVLYRCSHSLLQLLPAASLITEASFRRLASYSRKCARGFAYLFTLLYRPSAYIQPKLQSPPRSSVRSSEFVLEQTMNVACRCTVAESQDGLFYLARPTAWEHCGRICPTRQDHQSVWCSDSCLVL